jgi:zinc protease
MNARRGMLALLLAALSGLTAHAATPGVDAPPEPAPPLPISVPAFESFTLDNGLRVVVAPRRAVPLVTAQLLVLAGREADPDRRAGLAAMTASLVVKGARRGGREVGATELARQAEALGSTLDSAAGWRSASVWMTVTTPRLPEALALLADVARFPLLAADELERARAQALDGLRVSLGSPGEVAAMAARRAFWGAGVYGHSTTPASLQRLAVEEVRAFHHRHWRPDQAVLVLAGDIDADRARALAAPVLGGWARPASPPPVSDGAPAAPEAAAVVWVDMPGSGQSGVVVSAPFAALGDADQEVGEVANTLLGAGYSSRLNQVVRIERGLSYGAFSSAESHPEGGRWAAQAQTKHASAAEVVQLMRDAALRVAAEAPPAAELDARKAALIGGFASRLQTSAGLASLVAAQLAQGRSLDELARRVERVRSVTPAQVQAFAARHWKPGSLRAVVAGDWAAAGDSVKALGEDVQRVPQDRLDLERPSLLKAP